MRRKRISLFQNLWRLSLLAWYHSASRQGHCPTQGDYILNNPFHFQGFDIGEEV